MDFSFTSLSGTLQGNIVIRYFSDLWGPYTFSFNQAIPHLSVTIAAVTVKAYSGKVRPKDSLDDFTEITSSLIDPDYPIVANGTDVYIKFQWPGDDYKGTKATLVFELTFSSGAKHPFYFYALEIV